MNSENREFEFDFIKVLNIFKQNIIWLILAVVFFSAASALFTTFVLEKTYSTTVRFYVYSDAQSEVGGSITSSQLSAADTHAYSAMDILSTKECRQTMGADHDDIEVTSSKEAKAPIFSVVVSGSDRYKVCEIAETIKDSLPDYVYSITKIGKLTSYGFTGLDDQADSPNIYWNVIIAAVGGFVLAFIVLFLRSVLDTGIHDINDIKYIIDYPILGSIPIMVGDDDNDKHTSKKSSVSQRKVK